MCKNDENVSPYLRRPTRSYKQFLRDQASRVGRKNQRTDAPGKPSARELPKRGRDDADT